MPERFKVVCIPCKALYKCSDFFTNVSYLSAIEGKLLHKSTTTLLYFTGMNYSPVVRCLPALDHKLQVIQSFTSIVTYVTFSTANNTVYYTESLHVFAETKVSLQSMNKR